MSWTKARSELAVKTQRLGPDHPETIEARREFNAARLADYIEKTLATAPPLSDEQRAKLAELLRPARETITAARLVGEALFEPVDTAANA